MWRVDLAAGATLLVVYLATLAPGVTLWDSGEFLAAIHSLGIPHPPGTPVYILVANVWAKAWAPLFGFAYSVNLLSAVCTAVACGLLANLLVRWTGDRLASYAAAVTAGVMSSVWLSATETEVYSPALLAGCLLIWIANEARDTDETRWIFLGAYVAGLSWALHLTALLALPAAFYLAAAAFRRQDLKRLLALVILAALGTSAVLFLIVRAQHDPWVNQGNPATISALTDVLTRRQYLPAPLLPRQAPWFIQLGNIFEYADWQFALGLSPEAPPSWMRTPLTVVYALLGLVGFLEHRRLNRTSCRALLILFATGTLGVIVYLNLKAGPSYGFGFLPARAAHEARERDYFFAWGFLCWGLWAGFGSVRSMRVIANRLPNIGLLIALAPALLNWRAVDRRRGPAALEARDGAIRILASAPPIAVVLAHGDNETYPVWYLQEVERTRRDVDIVVVPLLPAEWYRAELARRRQLVPDDIVRRWKGTDAVLAAICANAHRQNRPVLNAGLVMGDSSFSRCEAR